MAWCLLKYRIRLDGAWCLVKYRIRLDGVVLN
jgi:hypothetical protein